jgi:prolyl oligopeptidase
MKHLFALIGLIIPICQVSETIAQPKSNYEAKQVSQIDNYFGQPVPDPYRWLEELESDETKDWLKNQSSIRSEYMGKLKKGAKIKNTLFNYAWGDENYTDDGGISRSYNYKYVIHLGYIALFKPAVLYYRNKDSKYDKIMLDPESLKSKKNEVVSINRFYRSPNEKHIAIQVSRSGSDWREIYIYDIQKEIMLPTVIKYVKFSNVAWLDDYHFYYVSSAPFNNNLIDTEKERSLKLHQVNTDYANDRVVYRAVNYKNNFDFVLDKNRKYLFIDDEVFIKEKSYKTIAYKHAHYDSLDNPKPFLTIPNEANLKLDILSVTNDEVFFYTNYKAKNYHILNQQISQTNKTNVLIPEKEDPMIEAYDLGKYILCLHFNSRRQYCMVYNKTGKLRFKLEIPEGMTADGFRSLTENPDIVFYELNSFYHNDITFKLDIGNAFSNPLHSLTVNYQPQELETRIVFYKSKDGTEVPMYLTSKKNLKLDGNNPTIIYAYGGFGISITPFFNPANIVFFENGGILAVPNIRGGGELGSDWHHKGSKLNKQNSFDDFIYAAKFLIDVKYTNPQRIAIRGGSNGGLLVTSVMCQKPELFKVVIAENGVYDMLRYQHFTAGGYWTDEYGVSTNESDFKNLLSYSPVHNLKEDIKYPATLVITGDNDDRVTPLHSYKFLATLQSKAKNKNPYVLYIEKNTGHNAPAIIDKRFETETVILQFIFEQMGIEPKVK